MRGDALFRGERAQRRLAEHDERVERGREIAARLRREGVLGFRAALLAFEQTRPVRESSEE